MAEVRGDYDVVLLGAGRDGYGDAKNQGRDSYAWTVNWDLRSGRAVPSAAYARVKATTTFNPVAFMVEWQSATGDPILIWTGGDTAGNATLYQWENATLTESDSNTPAFTGGALYRFDQDATEDVDEEMLFLCNGSSNDIIVRRKKDGTVDTGATTVHTAKADLLAVVGSDLYRTLTYTIGKMTTRTDPGIVGNYPTLAASVPAGVPSYPINSVLSLGASPYCTSGQGIFKYNPAPTDAVFGSVLEFRSPHPDNGKVAITDGRGRLYVADAYGRLLVLTFGFLQTHTPIKNVFFDRNTPSGKISAMAVDMDFVYLTLEPGTTNRTQDGMGQYVQEEDNGVFVDHTAVSIDRKWDGEGDISNLTASDDYLLIGATEPFMGAYIELAGKRDSETAASALTVEYSSGTSTWTSATIMDSTLAFTQDGFISFHNSFQHPFDHATPWTSFASAGDTNSINRYWMRIKPGSTLTGVTIRGVHLVPYRPPLTGDKNNPTDAGRMSGYKQAGALPTLLAAPWKGERLLWHDIATLFTSKIENMVVGRVNDGVTDSESALYMVSHDGLYAMPVGPDGDPVRASWPNLGHANTLAAGLNDHLVAGSENDFDLPAFPKTADEVIVRGKHLQEDDEFYVWLRAEHQAEWDMRGPFSQFPVVIKGSFTGKTLQAIAGYKDGSRDAIAPQIDSITVPRGKWSYDDEELIDELEEPISSPQKS